MKAGKVTFMEIRIGIVNTARELNFESADSAASIETAVAAALNGSAPFLKLSDDKGKVYLVPTATIGFVEIGDDKVRRVGFVA
ncbi:MAG: hypothetical protein RLZZ600_1053 [Actinomycetota bacterium]|jgi:hypothetical protein